MSFNRRQFLLFASAALGCGGFAAATRLLAASDRPTALQRLNLVDRLSSPRAQRQPVAAATASIANPPRGDVRIVVISDLNSQYGSTTYEPEVDRAIELMPVWQPDLVLCGGDMVAGQKTSLSTSELQAMWVGFDRHISAPLRRAGIPFGFTVGNHDASGILSGGQYVFSRDRAQTAAYWRNPAHEPGLQFVDRAQFPFYYSFQHSNIFFLVWDASTATIPPEQRAWAERSLSSPAAQNAKLRIVIGHLPLYAVAAGRDSPGEYLQDAEQLRSLLEKYHVHTYISGHDHAYYPGHKGQIDLLNSGVLGSGMRRLLNGNMPLMKTVTVVDINLAVPETRYTTYNMQTLTVVNQQQLPRLIASPTGNVLRRDVETADLTPAERSMTYPA